MYSQRNFSFPVLFLFWNRSFTNRYIYSLFSFIYLSDGQRTLFEKENPLNNWAYAMLSQMYIALPFALLNVLAFHSDETASLSQYNAILPLSIFIFNWVNDTGAYCTGMLFGKHKLFERISPKKSWEVLYWRRHFLYHSFFPAISLLPFHVYRSMDRTSIDSGSIRNLGRFNGIFIKTPSRHQRFGQYFTGTRWNARPF